MDAKSAPGRYYIIVMECHGCGMEHEPGALDYDEDRDCHRCPDCGSTWLTEKKVWMDDERA